MRSLLVVLLAVSSVAHAKKPKPAPANAAPVTLPCNYVPGAVYKYGVETTQGESKAGAPEDVTIYRTDYTFTVGGFEGGAVTASAMAGRSRIVDPPGDPVMAKVMGQLVAVQPSVAAEVRYSHDTDLQVTNIDELSRDYAKAIGAIRPAFEHEFASLPPEALAGILQWMDGTASNPAMVSQPYVEIGKPVFAYTCITIEPGSYDYPASLPNAFGGDPFPGRGTLAVGPAQGDRVHYVDAVVLDPVGAMAILAPILEGMGIELPPEVGLEDLQIDMSTRVDLDVSLADGWPIGWTTEQRVTAQGLRKITRTVVTRIE